MTSPITEKSPPISARHHHHYQHQHQHRTQKLVTTVPGHSYMPRSSSVPDVSSVTTSGSANGNCSVTRTSLSTVSSLGNTYQSGVFGSFFRRHPEQQRQIQQSDHPPSDPTSSLDPPQVPPLAAAVASSISNSISHSTSKSNIRQTRRPLPTPAAAMPPPSPRGDPAMPGRGSDPEGQSDDLRSLSSMGTATFRRLRDARLAARRTAPPPGDKAKDSDENNGPDGRRGSRGRRRSADRRDGGVFDSRNRSDVPRGSDGHRARRRRHVYNEVYDGDNRDDDDDTVGGAIGDYYHEQEDDVGGSSVTTECTRNGSNGTRGYGRGGSANGGDSFFSEFTPSSLDGEKDDDRGRGHGGYGSRDSSSSRSRRHPPPLLSRGRSPRPSRFWHGHPSRNRSRGRNERLSLHGSYHFGNGGDRTHLSSRRRTGGCFRSVTAVAVQITVVLALGFLTVIQLESVDVAMLRRLAGSGATTSSSSSSSLGDAETHIPKRLSDRERGLLRGYHHPSGYHDASHMIEMESSSSQPSQTLEGSEWSPQQSTQQSKQWQLQEKLYFKPRSQLQYLGQSHLPAQSAQSRNRKDGMDQYQYHEDDEQGSDKDNADNYGIDEEEDEEEDDDDGSGQEKIFEKVDLHDSQDIKLYTGEEEPVEDETEENVEVAVPVTKDEETVFDGESTKIVEDDVDPKVEPEEDVLRVRDGIEDIAGASPEEFPVELVSDSGLIDHESKLPPEGGEKVMELGSDETEEPWQQLQRQQQQNQQQQLQLQQQKQQQIQQLQEMESESNQTQQQLEKREESSTLDSDSTEELERQSQQSPESDLPLEVEVGQDNLVQIDSAENNGAPQDSVDYLDHLFKFQQSDEELNYGDPQLERQLPPQWQQQQEQQQQHEKEEHQETQGRDQRQEDLPGKESAQGGRLQNFQKNIHQFDQQQQEMEQLQQQKQQQQQLQQQQEVQPTDSEGIISDGADNAYATNLVDNDGSRKPNFSELNRNDPKVSEFAEAGVDGSANNAEIDQPNLEYGDRKGFSGNNVAGDSSNINSFGNNFVEQNAGIDNGMVQNGIDSIGDQSVFHQGVEHNNDPDLISISGVNYLQGGGAFANGIDDRIDNNEIVNVDHGINHFQGDAFQPNKGDGEDINNGFVNDVGEIDNVEGVGAFANGVNDRIEGNGFVNLNRGINNFQGDASHHYEDNNHNTQSGLVDDNGVINNVQGLGVFPNEVNDQDNGDGLARGNNGVNNLQGVAFPNEVIDQVNSNGFVSEFAANSPGPYSEGKNQQFDQMSVLKNEFNSNENQNFYSPLDANSDSMRQFDNRFLPPDFISNSENDLIEAQPNLIRTAASQTFGMANYDDRSNTDQFNNDSNERQNSNALNFDGDQENSSWNGENLGRLALLNSDSQLLENKHNTAVDVIGGKTFRNDLISSGVTVSDGNSNVGRIIQADVNEQRGFPHDSDIRQEVDIQGQGHVLRQADLQGQHDFPNGAGSQLHENFQQNFGSNTQADIVPPERTFSRQEESFHEGDGSEEQYDHKQVDHFLESSELHKESTAQEQAEFYEGLGSPTENAQPIDEMIQSRQIDHLQDRNDVTLEAVLQEQAHYRQDSNGQEQNVFREEGKYNEQLNSRQVANPEERAGLDDEAELEAEELDFKAEEFQPHSHVQDQADFQPQQQHIEQQENTESLLLSGNPDKNQIDSRDTTDKNEVEVGNASNNQSIPVVTQSETLNRAPHAKGRNMADDVDLQPNAELGQRREVQDSAQFVEKSQTNGERDEQITGDSQQLSQIIVGNGASVDLGIQDRIQQSERIFDSDDMQLNPAKLMEQHVDMDAYEMSPFGGLNDERSAGAEPTFQHIPQVNNKMTDSLEGQKPESIELHDQDTKFKGYPSVSEYYSSIRKESAIGNMIAEGEKTILQKRREQRQQLRQQ